MTTEQRTRSITPDQVCVASAALLPLIQSLGRLLRRRGWRGLSVLTLSTYSATAPAPAPTPAPEQPRQAAGLPRRNFPFALAAPDCRVSWFAHNPKLTRGEIR